MDRLRLLLVSAGFAVSLITVLTAHFLLAVPHREHYMRNGRKIALLQKDFFPPRARLLAADGTPVAWSERRFDLIWDEAVPPDGLLLRKVAEELGIRPVPEAAPDRRNWLLIVHLTPEQLLRAGPLAGAHPALKIRPRLERISIHQEGLREKIGATGLRNGVQYGISGWEKEYDEQLRGTPGRFEVMLDRRRRWINSSWKLLVPAVPGKDVKVPWEFPKNNDER